DPLRMSRPAWDALLQYRWPGNVRELKNTLERAASSARGGVILRSDLALGHWTSEAGRHPNVQRDPVGCVTPVVHPRYVTGMNAFRVPDGRFKTAREMEAEHIREALRLARGNKAEAARLRAIVKSCGSRRVRRRPSARRCPPARP